MTDRLDPDRRPQGRHLMTFAVIADTHANQSETYSSSPYPCNALANARARRVIAEVNQRDPAFVLHLGDIVNPVPELPTYAEAADNFKALARDLAAPLHVVPGNHDVGDKPVHWMPAGTVNEEHLALYEHHFGSHFYSFDHEELHIVIVNASIINSGLVAENEQRQWLEADLAANSDRRTFICIHYPPYVCNPDESGSYDNIDEPGRSWLLSLIERFRPEAMFCGHVHNFWYDVYENTEIYILPSTAFVRHDYSEFFRGDPGDQHGRNDEAKLGYFMVRVYEHGHVAENVRTYGRTLAAGEALAPSSRGHYPPHTKESAVTSVGVDMRHPWAEEMEIAPSGALDEFERKKARNDYPLLALWEMGLRRMRLPLHDLCNEPVRRRMQMLKKVGHVFQVYSYGLPTGKDLETLVEHAALVDVLELIVNWESVDTWLPVIRDVKTRAGFEVYLSRVNRKDGDKHTGARFNHLISHGFVEEEGEEVAALQERSGYLFDGFLFRVVRDRNPISAALFGHKLGERLRSRICLYVKTSSASPAETFDDAAANAARVASATVAGLTVFGVDVILDTFVDVDRGYFARTGLVDRLYNPRVASHTVRNLVALMGQGGWEVAEAIDSPGVSIATVRAPGGDLYEVRAVDPTASSAAGEPSSTQWIDLETGMVGQGFDELPAGEDRGGRLCAVRVQGESPGSHLAARSR